MNDPDQTMGLPVTEFSGESNGASPRGAFPPNGTSNPPKDTRSTTSYPQIADAEPSRFKPTVFGAVRRYRGMFLAVVVLAVVIAVGYSLLQPKVYRAQALITMPQQVSLPGQSANSGQYLDSQVILLQSQQVGQLAATIANAELHSHSLAVGDFFGSGSSLEISPPQAANVPGAYGATVIGVSFAASTAQFAQVGDNAVVQAYHQTRSATVRSQANAAITGIDNAIDSTNQQLAQLREGGSGAGPYVASLQQQLSALEGQRAQLVADEAINLPQQPTVASEAATIANHEWALDGGIGLTIGILLGGALAFVLARRRGIVAQSQDPSPKQGVQPLSASDHWTTTAASSQLPPQG